MIKENLILASSSPRRIELMKRLDFPFMAIAPQNEEKLLDELSIQSRIEKLSFDKANEIYQKHPDKIIVGADTVIIFENEILGKPHTAQKAVQMLKRLQNQTHQVLTAVTVMSKDKIITFSSVSDVTLQAMSIDEIKSYVDTNEPLDKAGAYTIQDKGALFIKSIKGDFYGVMGLPISKLYQVLKNDFNLYQ